MTDYAEVLEWFGSREATPDQLREIRSAIDEVVPEDEPDRQYWETEEDTVIELGGERIDLITRGPAQLKQIGDVRDWLKGYLKPALDRSFEDDVDVENVGTAEGIDVLVGILDPDALVALASAVIQKDKEFVTEHFDVGWAIDATLKVLNGQPALRRLTQGFFRRR